MGTAVQVLVEAQEPLPLLLTGVWGLDFRAGDGEQVCKAMTATAFSGSLEIEEPLFPARETTPHAYPPRTPPEWDTVSLPQRIPTGTGLSPSRLEPILPTPPGS